MVLKRPPDDAFDLYSPFKNPFLYGMQLTLQQQAFRGGYRFYVQILLRVGVGCGTLNQQGGLGMCFKLPRKKTPASFFNFLYFFCTLETTKHVHV